LSAARKTLSLVAAEFNVDVVGPMIDAAADEARVAGADIVRTTRVPGCYEMPIVANAELARGDCDALVVLGYIERGETQHGTIMGQVVHDALVRLEIAHGKPIGKGIIGPGATVDQAHARKDPYARAAVRAALRSLAALEATGRA
jgi:6,7-dimethyl-8-ribityllumazine synthase